MPRFPRSAAFALPLLLLAACHKQDDTGSRGTTNNVPENSGMGDATGVGDNAPGGSDAAPVQGEPSTGAQ